MIDVALIGCGHMGRHHARVISQHPGSRLVGAVDIVPERAARIAEHYGALAHVPDRVDAVVVATPTHTHLEVARPFVERQVWCLVEKPVATTRAAAELLDSEHLTVGHSERFNPAVRAAGPMRPTHLSACRISPHTGRSTDIDVLLDLMIHDLDLLLHWAGPDARVAHIEADGHSDGDRLDTARAWLRLDNGCTATLHASRVADRRRRTIDVYEGPRHTTLDLMTGTATRHQRSMSAEDSADALTAQWQAFCARLGGRDSGAVHGSEGVRAIELVERIRDTIGEGGTQ